MNNRGNHGDTGYAGLERLPDGTLVATSYCALDLRVPTRVMAEVPEPSPPGRLPKAAVITWEFAARGKMQGLFNSCYSRYSHQYSDVL